MKKLFVLLGIVTFLHAVSLQKPAYAAACSTGDTYGAVRIVVPTLPSKGEYTVWTRMQIPDEKQSQYELEINGETCYTVGGSSITPGQWEWVSFQDGIISNTLKHNFQQTNENSLRLIGTQAGVKIDRVLLLKNDCIPQDLGTNCKSDTTLINPNDIAGATEVLSPESVVSGLLIVSPTVQRSPSDYTKVVYVADGVQLPITDGLQLDTTLLENGLRRITMQITSQSGVITNETTTLNVENKQTIFSPLVRWARIHAEAAYIIFGVSSVLLVAAIVLIVVRRRLLEKRLLHFRGF